MITLPSSSEELRAERGMWERTHHTGAVGDLILPPTRFWYQFNWSRERSRAIGDSEERISNMY